MGIRTTIPPGATPMAAVDAIMALYGRENIELAIETLIGRLDQIDGDPDLEDFDCDLEPDGTGDGDPAWNEWHTRGGHKLLRDAEPVARLPWGGILHEDAEDDDPAENDDAAGCDAGDDNLTDWGGWIDHYGRARDGRLEADYPHDNEDTEKALQPAVTPYAVGNDL